MPCTVLVRVPEARNLPVMDRQSESTDAFVEVRLGKDEDLKKSEVCRHSLNPTWDCTEWFKFELDDDELQDEPLQVRVIDHDKISSHDVIGRVYVSLGPLLVNSPQDSGPPSLDGWFPIYDTLRGVRGEVRVVAQLQMLMDANRYRQSSAGVTFRAAMSLPVNYCAHKLHGFVEELVINDDPEHQWIDNIRSKRKSNEERQIILQKLSCELQRRVGVKVLEAGANAVLGYRQCIDLEGESGIVLRCVGTMAMIGLNAVSTPPLDTTGTDRPATLNCTPPTDSQPPCGAIGLSPSTKEGKQRFVAFGGVTGSDSIPHTPSEMTVHGNNLASQMSSSFSEDEHMPIAAAAAVPEGSATRRSSKPTWLMKQAKMSEFPFYTMSAFPAGVLQKLAGLVACRSVEYLGVTTDEAESRDAWWQKPRREMMSHMQAWGCNTVIGYQEQVTIDDEVVVLSASGTAAFLNLSAIGSSPVPYPALPEVPVSAMSTAAPISMSPATLPPPVSVAADDRHRLTSMMSSDPSQSHCSVLHLPSRCWDVLLRYTSPTKCMECGQAAVPSKLLSTAEIPPELNVIGRGCIVQTRVCRVKKKTSGEANAVAISGMLPFIESTVHSKLLSKLHRMKMNAVFGLNVQLSVSEVYVIAVATGTAVRLAALPLVGDNSAGGTEMQRKTSAEFSPADSSAAAASTLTSAVATTPGQNGHAVRRASFAADQCDFEHTNAVLGEGKGSTLLEVDDVVADDDGPSINELVESDEIWCSTLQTTPGCPFFPSQFIQAHHLCVVTRVAIDSPRSLESQLSRTLQNATARLCYRAAAYRPCRVCKVDFDIKQYEDGEECQVTVKASVFSYESTLLRSISEVSSDHDPLSGVLRNQSPVRPITLPSRSLRLTHPRNPQSTPVTPQPSTVHFVMISSCDGVPGCQVLQHRGHVCVFLVRESTSLREDHGSLGGMLYAFLIDAQALVRSHCNALGGNALLSFHVEILELDETSNAGQCLLVASGDAVVVCESDRDTAV